MDKWILDLLEEETAGLDMDVPNARNERIFSYHDLLIILEKYAMEKESPKYKEGFRVLIEYFDSISDEEKPDVDKQLKELGL